MQIKLSLLFFISKYKIYKDSSLLNNTQNLKSGLYLYILYEQLLTDKLPHNIATCKPKKKIYNRLSENFYGRISTLSIQFRTKFRFIILLLYYIYTTQVALTETHLCSHLHSYRNYH